MGDECRGGAERATEADERDVARQLGRRPRALRRVVVRCPWGLPAVTEQEPYDERGEPFPTTYYLTCRNLIAAVSRVEAAGGVERWSAALAQDDELARDLERATAEQVAIRRSLAAGRTGADGGASLGSGIGGSRNPTQLKCLHAHVAFALARPGHLIGERVLAELPARWPAGGCCSLAGVAEAGPSTSIADRERRGRERAS